MTRMTAATTNHHAPDQSGAHDFKEQTVNGYLILDRETKEIDWNLFTSIDQAINSLTGPRHMYCKTEAEEDKDKTYWKRHYMICPVGEEIEQA